MIAARAAIAAALRRALPACLLLASLCACRGSENVDAVKAQAVAAPAERQAPSPLPLQREDVPPTSKLSLAPEKRLRLSRQFEASDDLYGLMQRLQTLESAGDPEAMWQTSRIYEYCAGYALDPVGYASDTQAIANLGLASARTLQAARERVGRRCARFVPDDGLTATRVQAKLHQAAAAGSLAAEAALLAAGTPKSTDGTYLHDLVARVLDSRDPEAYVAIAPAMGLPASGRETDFGEVSGTPLTELAWLVAACRLGQDCGAASALATSYCANGGICSRRDAQDFASFVADAAIAPQNAEDFNRMVNELLYGTGVLK